MLAYARGTLRGTLAGHNEPRKERERFSQHEEASQMRGKKTELFGE